MNRKTLLTISIIGILITGIGFPLDAFADVVSPNKQLNAGFEKSEVFCKANLYKVIKKSNGMPYCVNPEIVTKLVQMGWAIPVNNELLDSFINKINNRTTSIGTVTIQSVLKQTSTTPPKVTTSSLAATHYHVVFKVCSNDKDIRLPEVILRSDTAVSYVKLVDKIPANTCNTSAGKIQAANKDTITADLVNKGGVTKKITELENKVKELSEQLNAEKSILSSRIKQAENLTEFTPDENRISKISELRTQLNSAKDELSKYQFSLNMTPKTKVKNLDVSKTFTGVPIEGVTVNLLAIKKQLVGGGYDLAFEMCAGKQTVRVPIVLISSDEQEKSIKISDRILPNTCQISGAKVNATSVNSIQVSVANTAEISSVVLDLENKILELTTSLETQKAAYNKLTHQAPRPADFKDQEASIVNNIIELREQIILEKAKLYNLLNQVYD